VYKYPGMTGGPSGWQYANVVGVQNGLLSVMYNPSSVEHLSPANPGVVARMMGPQRVQSRMPAKAWLAPPLLPGVCVQKSACVKGAPKNKSLD